MTPSSEKPVRVVPHKHPLNDTQRATLSAMCDLMIPASADGKMPAASLLGIYDDISDLTEAEVTALSDGLSQIEAVAQRSHNDSFSALAPDDAQALFDGLRSELRRFTGIFTVQTAARYYSHDQVMPLIGLEARPPWPKGNVVDQGDWSLLDPVRKRAPMYREPGK